MAVNTGYLSNMTADFQSHMSLRGPIHAFSTLSVRGAATLHAALNSASAISGGAITGTTGTFSSLVSGVGNITGQQIIASAGSAIGPTLTFASDTSRGFYLSTTSTIAMTSGTTLNLRTGSVRVSWHTNANSNGLSIGELAIVFATSGISLVYSSGASVYVLGQSSQSAAQA